MTTNLASEDEIARAISSGKMLHKAALMMQYLRHG